MAAGSMIEQQVNSESRGYCLLQLKPLEVSSPLDKPKKLFSPIGGGFTYKSQSRVTRNRHILWRIVNNALKLEECCLDFNLTNCKLEITIPGEVFLPNVVIQTSGKLVAIIVATTTAIYLLEFPHPSVLSNYSLNGVNAYLPSIFQKASETIIYQQISLERSCSHFDVAFSSRGVPVFGLISDSHTLFIVNRDTSFFELSDSSITQRLWNGLVPSFVRGDNLSYDGVESLVLHSFTDSQVFAFALCRDLKLRVWNIITHLCIHTTDLVSLIPDKLNSQFGTVESLCLRKVCDGSNNGQLVLAVHCATAYSSQFVLLEVFREKNEIVVLHISHFFSNFNNAQDIGLTPQHLWVLWNTTEGEQTLSYAPIEGGKLYERGWHCVHMKNPLKDDVFVPIFRDAKEVYMERIFSAQLYERESVISALKVFSKTNDLTEDFLPDEMSSLLQIKESVLRIIDLQVESNVLNAGVREVGYQGLVHECWTTFYSYIQQFSQFQRKPLGLHVSTDKLMVVRQGTYGVIRPLSWLDHLHTSDMDALEGVYEYIDMELNLKGDRVAHDVLILIEAMKSISKQFPIEVLLGIDNDLHGNEDVKIFLSSMADALITNSSEFDQLVGEDEKRADFLSQMEARLKHLKNPEMAVRLLVDALKIDNYREYDGYPIGDLPVQSEELIGQMFCGCHGINILLDTITTTTYNRIHICRDLFVLLKLMSIMTCMIDLNLSASKEFGLVTTTTVYELLRSYHAVYWAASTTAFPIDTDTVDVNLAHLASLHLSERSPLSNVARKTDSAFSDFQLISLLSSFVKDVGIFHMLDHLKESATNIIFADLLNEATSFLLSEVWMLNNSSCKFLQYLTGHCQYSLLNEHLHLADDWCVAGRSTKDFFLAQSYLGCNEPVKAYKYFVSAARGITLKEPLLLDFIEAQNNPKQEALVCYFIKVMRMFEQWCYPLMVITTASSALTIDNNKSSYAPMLWSVVFKNRLELEHYNDAYAAIIHNPDKTRKHDCLRHFIITLCERGMFKDICLYPYVGLEEEVVEIIEARARTMDITVNKYYDLLYSYHILKSDYRKASTTMYEQACRLATEMHGLKSLQKQAKCYLATLNALMLVDRKYAWIIRPKDQSEQSNIQTTETTFSQSPKRRGDGEKIFYSTSKKKFTHGTAIIELQDVEREYLLILARLKLVQHGKNEAVVIGPGLSAEESVALLSQSGLFDMAFTVARHYRLKLNKIFETLAGKCACVTRSHQHHGETDDDCSWLLNNEIFLTQLVPAGSAAKQAFLLLQNYLGRFKDSSSYLKAVTWKLLSMGCPLPSWLVKDYELVKPAELLHLYLCYDMVGEATQLAVKYIDAVLGVGKEQLGLQSALHATTPPVWLPYTSLDQLLYAARSNYDHPESSQLCEALQEKLDAYFSRVESVSCGKTQYKQSIRVSRYGNGFRDEVF